MITQVVNKSRTVMMSQRNYVPTQTQKISVLIVDDDYRIRNLLKRFLKKNDYIAISAKNSEVAIEHLKNFRFEIVIVDVMMPGTDGFELTKIISENFNVPVFMLTARTEMTDKLQGFKNGADDYLTKPFEPEELLVRIKAIVRRNQLTVSEKQTKALTDQGFNLDFNKQILNVNGNKINLTANEMALLHVFDIHKNKVLSREKIVNELNSKKEFSVSNKKIINNRLIDLQITRLRKKIEPNPTHPTFLKTVRGLGYKLFIENTLS